MEILIRRTPDQPSFCKHKGHNLDWFDWSKWLKYVIDSMGLVRSTILTIKLQMFSYPLILTHVLGAQKIYR